MFANFCAVCYNTKKKPLFTDLGLSRVAVFTKPFSVFSGSKLKRWNEFYVIERRKKQSDCGVCYA